jgi:hypothetical protein
MDAIITLVGSGIVSILIAYLTAHYKTKSELEKERAKLQFDIVMKQKHDYFLPFKYCADEFRRRLVHIDAVFKHQDFDNDKYENMIKRLKQDFSSRSPEWFFNDAIGPEGGYFITATMYLNCTLFYWMKRIQAEHPFIPLDLDEKPMKAMEEYRQYAKEEKILTSLDHKECDVYDFIKNIKIAISREKGIPYGLHDSLGDFLFDYSNKRLINYEEFCDQLRDDKKRVKFLPVIKFWTGLVCDNDKVDQDRLRKIKVLLVILELFNRARIRESLK